MSESKQKHLEFIQTVIARLSSNSFLIKGWTVLLVSAFFALAAPNANLAYVFLAYIPAVIFWGLDGFFLYQERLFRELYDFVRRKDGSDIDYSMDTTNFKSSKISWVNSTLSITLIPFYGSLLAAIILVMFFHIIQGG